MKDLHEMDLGESVDYWTGYLTLEIGRGNSVRNAIASIVLSENKKGFDRGLEAGQKKGKKP